MTTVPLILENTPTRELLISGNGALYRNVQENGFTRYDTCHSAEQVARAYLDIFQKSLEKK